MFHRDNIKAKAKVSIVRLTVQQNDTIITTTITRAMWVNRASSKWSYLLTVHGSFHASYTSDTVRKILLTSNTCMRSDNWVGAYLVESCFLL